MASLTHALREAEGALSVLARYGHVFHLEPGPGEPPALWPRLMFHVAYAPNGRLVRDEYEYDTMGEGWFDTMEEAQHAAGYDTQMTSRGGRPRRSRAIVALDRPLSAFERIAARDAVRKAARERAMKERKDGL